MNNCLAIETCTDEAIRLLAKNSRAGVRRTAISLMKGKRPKKDVAFWPNAQLVYALSFDSENSKYIKMVIRKWQRSNFAITKYDDILMGYVLIWKTDFLNDEQKNKIEENIHTALSSYKYNSIPYRLENKRRIYIDLLGMVPQFLISDGVEKGDVKLIDWGIKQFTDFIKNATDEKTGLPYHAYDSASGERFGAIGWGRAMGWMLMGLSESILALPKKYNKERTELLNIYKKYLDTIKPYQRQDGGFSWWLLSEEGPLDSSATAMILQSMMVVYSGIKDKYSEMAQKMLECLDTNCYDQGKVIHCSAECGGAGVYPQKYGSFPWSVAPYLICKILEKKNNGVFQCQKAKN